MKELLKAQLTIGLLAYFSTVWGLVLNRTYEDIVASAGLIALQLVLMLVLSYVIMSLLQWVRLFDLKTNAMLTLMVLIGLGLAISFKTPIF
jgi:hypothetical protein